MHSLLELSGEQTATLLDGIMLSHSGVLLDKVEVGAARSIAALLKLSLPQPIKTAALSEYCSAGLRGPEESAFVHPNGPFTATGLKRTCQYHPAAMAFLWHS